VCVSPFSDCSFVLLTGGN